jgi:chemotaxis protein CheY-P-specific phosphatase CheC
MPDPKFPISPRASGGPTKTELKEMLQQAQTKEMLSSIAGQFATKLSTVFISVLNNFSPNLQVGMKAMLNTLCSTAAKNRVPLEELQTMVAAEYNVSKEAIDKALAGTSGVDDPQVGGVNAEGTAAPLIQPVSH